MKKLTAKQSAVIANVIEDFKTGRVASACAMATFTIPGDMPAGRWTLSNRWLAYLTTGSVDARTFNQWKGMGRRVMKGERAGLIWRPIIIKVKDENGRVVTDDNGKEKTKCIGFAPVMVFGVNQTSGDDLNYEDPKVNPNLPLLDVAKAWDIEVKADWFTGAGGSCKIDGSEITMNSRNARVFLHELSHAAHAKVKGSNLTGGQDAWQEIVAEFSAEVLRRIVNPSDEDTSGNAYDYIQHYADSKGVTVTDACLKCLRDAGKVVALILDTAAEIGTVEAADVA